MNHPAIDVVVVHSDTGKQTLTVEGFLSLPLDERIRLVIARRVEFFARDDKIPATEALKRLRTP